MIPDLLQQLKFKKIPLLGFTFMVIAILTILWYQFTRKSTPTTDIPARIYFADNISSAHEALIKRFNETYRGEIEVIPVNLPFSKFSTNERKELLARSLRSKSDLIDVFAVDLIWVPRFAKWCEPLDIHIGMQGQQDILPYALESCYYAGRLVALPLYLDVGMMYFRKDILQNLPEYPQLLSKLKESISWEEFIQLKQDHFSNTEDFYLFAAKSYEGLICSFIELLVAQNAGLFNKNSIQLNTPEARKALQLLVDLVNKYHLSPSLVVNFDEYQSYLYALEKDAVFLRGWPGFLRHYRKVVPDSTKFEFFDIAALPHFAGFRPVSVFGGWNLMISKYSNHKRASLTFIQFAMQPESQEILFSAGGYIPVNQQVYQDSTFVRAHPDLHYYQELLQRGIHRPYRPDYTRISDIISYYVHKSIKNEISVEEALSRATASIASDRFILK